jgi:SagB-type dehydrogenase family enzyme
MINAIGKNLKTISNNLYIDMVDEVMQFHNKGNLMIDKKFNEKIAPHTLKYDQLRYLERSDFEISPFHDQDITCDSTSHIKIRRNRTAKSFSDKAQIPFGAIQTVLHHSFAMSKDGSRPYPSSGGLYSVEVICVIFAERVHESPVSGFYHYRPHHHLLQPLKTANSQKINEVLYGMEQTESRTPNFALLYIVNVGKMLVKYRYRGYRYALMETGAMFQQADLISQCLGLINKLYSGFNDYELIKFIGLDPINFFPLVIQSFGVNNENAT